MKFLVIAALVAITAISLARMWHHAWAQGALPAFKKLVLMVGVTVIAIASLGLANAGVMPVVFHAAGASLLVVIGFVFGVMALSGSAIRFEESLLRASANPINIDRVLGRSLGKQYFRYKWLLLAFAFIASGVVSLLR